MLGKPANSKLILRLWAQSTRLPAEGAMLALK